MRQYQNLLKQVMDHGDDRETRNGMTRSLFGLQMRFKMKDGFPAMTTKKLLFKSVKSELLWFIEGSSDERRLREINGSDWSIWTDNAEAPYWQPKAKFPGDLGRVYGVQWRSWQTPDGRTIDQLADVIHKIKTNPTDRRLIVSAWNAGELDQMALPPCHMFFQFFVSGNKLSVLLHQRSADIFLGVPFNIASYSLLLHMVAQSTGLEPDDFVHNLGDAHIYHDHFSAVEEQLSREPMAPPSLWLNPEIKDIDAFTMKDIKLKNYESHPMIQAKMLV